MMADNIVAMMRSLRIAVRGEVEPGPWPDRARAHSRPRPRLAGGVGADDEGDREPVGRGAAANALLVSLFAALALLLAAIGVGGCWRRRSHAGFLELGVRMALGAQRRTLVAMVIRHGMVLAAAGLAVGLPSAWLLSRVLSSLLFEISPRDPMTFATVAAVPSVVALVACAIPAWRVTRVDPITVLRME